MSTPAGWYPSPEGGQRYWDGRQWTEHYAPPQPTVPVPVAPVVPVYGYATPVVSPKSPGVCLLVSFFIPGVGSFMAERGTTGTIILIGYFASLFLICVFIGFVTAPAFWVWGMIDAYTGAQAWNRRHGIIS